MNVKIDYVNEKHDVIINYVMEENKIDKKHDTSMRILEKQVNETKRNCGNTVLKINLEIFKKSINRSKSL